METSDQHRGADRCSARAGCKRHPTTSAPALGTELLRVPSRWISEIVAPSLRHIPFNEQDRLLLDGIINIVHNLGMQVVIEGWRPGAAQLPSARRCAFTQGYLLSRPLPLRRSDQYLSLNRQGMNLANLTTVS